jgi:GTP-binding protein YchF
MRIGIVGLPNAGKSSLFNALTRAGAEAANYPFTTLEPNVAVVPVPDERLDLLAETIKATPTVYETIAFHDIAGLVRGASKGEGLGNQFLANIRETDAILHVVRAHGDSQVVHPEGRVDPGADIDTIETELIYADLEQAERRLDRVARTAKSGERAAVAEVEWLRALIEALSAGRPARTVPPPADAPDAMRALQPLTSKPVLYVANVDEGAELVPPAPVMEHATGLGAGAVAVSARLDAELSELDDEEAAVMREEMGAAESGLSTVIRGAFELLDLISFYTAGEGKEARAHAIPRGTTAWGAAGKIHTDIQRGFVRAEVASVDALVEGGGYAGARDRGTLRLEGRDYVMQDGDVITIKFTP